MSKPVTPRAKFDAEVREILADPRLNPGQRQQRISAAADEYAARLAEAIARPHYDVRGAA